MCSVLCVLTERVQGPLCGLRSSEGDDTKRSYHPYIHATCTPPPGDHHLLDHQLGFQNVQRSPLTRGSSDGWSPVRRNPVSDQTWWTLRYTVSTLLCLRWWWCVLIDWCLRAPRSHRSLLQADNMRAGAVYTIRWVGCVRAGEHQGHLFARKRTAGGRAHPQTKNSHIHKTRHAQATHVKLSCELHCLDPCTFVIQPTGYCFRVRSRRVQAPLGRRA